MVIYDLVCCNAHAFEGWFKNSDDFSEQVAQQLVRCPICDTEKVERKLSTLNVASSISRSSKNDARNSHNTNGANAGSEETGQSSSESSGSVVDAAKQAVSELMRVITPEEKAEVVRDFVEKNFEDVGNDFTDEVRKIHYGESEERGIRGQATAEEVADLEEEGISTLSIPAPKANDKLN